MLKNHDQPEDRKMDLIHPPNDAKHVDTFRLIRSQMSGW
jgi:hypothetical protein